ncbi:Sybindin-like family protein [Ancylostoma caninum]|uniref:Trafficking protein particle complex subunit 4 n=1 Tax=Ancylostoma caninum TaxID=29170 RepID=A0A368G057_ANCCA|nr:Sybindin-like family protein [Ancylostoma caninum]
MISGERSHLSAVFRSFEDSCLASERIQDSTSKLIELDTRRQKIREASRLLKKPRQVRAVCKSFQYILMSIQQVFIISRAGSLIYDWEAKSDVAEVERICEYPLDIILEEIDQKAVVVFGEKDGVKLRYYVTGANGFKVSGTKFFADGVEKSIFKYLEDEANFPVGCLLFIHNVFKELSVSLCRSWKLHNFDFLACKAEQVLLPLMDYFFRLESERFIAGVKFVVVTTPSTAIPVESLLNKLYELYADYALKNPFYAIDMPIRCSKFEEGLKSLLERVDKNSSSMTVDTNFSFLSKIPDQCGYLVFADGAIVKSDGELSNREGIMHVVEKIVNVPNTLPGTRFNQLTVSYSDHFYTISQSGKYTFVVKRKVHS